MDTPHLGPYQWTRNGDPRPMTGSPKHLEYEELEKQRRAAALATPEGQAWLARQGQK